MTSTRADAWAVGARGDKAHPLAEARRALFRWAEIISSGEVDAVLALYAPDAILVPTLSDEIRECEEERRQYFEVFLANEGLRCTITHYKKRVIPTALSSDMSI